MHTLRFIDRSFCKFNIWRSFSRVNRSPEILQSSSAVCFQLNGSIKTLRKLVFICNLFRSPLGRDGPCASGKEYLLTTLQFSGCFTLLRKLITLACEGSIKNVVFKFQLFLFVHHRRGALAFQFGQVFRSFISSFEAAFTRTRDARLSHCLFNYILTNTWAFRP